MELFSVRVEDADREPDRTLPRPLSCEPTTVSDPDRDLNSELFSAKPEAKTREPDRDLNSEFFSARLEAEPSEALRVKARPLIPEPESDREPVRDLNSEDFSARLEIEDSEPVRDFARPLT